jgi:amino acid transporter
MWGTRGAALITAGALVSVCGFLTAQMLHTPRLTFALAEGGDFPQCFARVHPRYRTPHVSILVFAGIVWCLAAVGSFQWNVILSSVARLFIYGFTCAALPVLRRKNPGARAYRVPAGIPFSVFGVLFMAALASRMNRGEGAVVVVTITVAFANWFWTRDRPDGRFGT